MKLSEIFVSRTFEKAEFDKFVPAPLMRKSFELKELPEKAEISICGLGFYRLFINGEEITKGILAPYISNPDDICCYDIYDVTKKLRKGKNAIGVILGNGMQNCPGGKIWHFDRAEFRSSPKLAFCLCADGKYIIADASSFVCRDSAIKFDDLRSGEVYDANDETEGWADADFDDSDWDKVLIASTPKGIKRVTEADPIVCTKYLHPVLIGKAGLIQPEAPQSFENMNFAPEDERITEGYLFDFGVNAAGIFRLEINAKKGQKIILQMGEYYDNNGNLNLYKMYFLPREFDHRAVYTAKEGLNIYEPSFTYFGYRYCLIAGITEEQAKELKLVYKVCNSDLKRVGFFRCSDEIANKLYDNCIVSDLANFYYFPTDCPHREKNGWTGDAACSAEQFMTNFDCYKSFAEWMRHIEKSQDEKGAIPGIIPTGGWGFAWGNGPGWDAVLAQLPYNAYKFKGDKSILEENADTLFRYVLYMIKYKQNDKGLYEYGLGDWCPVGGKIKPPLVLTDSIINYDTLNKAAYIFGVLGQTERADVAKAEASRLRNAIRTHLITDCVVAGNCQTSQAMALFYGIFDECEYQKAYGILLDMIHSFNNSMDCGIFGARVIFRLLSDNGEYDLAWNMINKTEEPSFGHWVAQGATSMWENFGEVQSRNHHFFGDISAFFIKYAAGIDFNPNMDDVNNVVISPCFFAALDNVNGETNGVYTSWQRTGKGIRLNVSAIGKHGKIKLRTGKFADGTTEKALKNGSYDIIL